MEIRKCPKKTAAVDSRLCVACGCCVRVCPLSAIRIAHGVTAVVDPARCVGCGRCAAECPASVIQILETAAPDGKTAGNREGNA